MNVATNEKSVPGHHISDALIILAAVDPCYCCTERLTIVDRSSGKRRFNADDLLRLSQEKTAKLQKRFKF